MHTTKLTSEAALSLFKKVYMGEAPTENIEHILVGRESEIASLLDALNDTRSGGHTMKFIVGPYGSGKTTFLNVTRSYAIEDHFVCASATLLLCPLTSRRVYSMLMNSLSVSLPDIINTLVEKIGAKDLPEVLGAIRMENSRYFTMAILRYLDAIREENKPLAQDALNWLRGEYRTITEARSELGIQCTITDGNWYSMLKVFTRVLVLAGFSGLCVLLDEVSSLYALPNSTMRGNNFTKLQSIYSDNAHYGAGHMLFLVAGTKEFIEDSRRGLASSPALYSRICEQSDGHGQDYSQTIMRLHTLSQQELYTLLSQLKAIEAIGNGQEPIDEADEGIDNDVVAFLSELNAQPGGLRMVTPREATRKFCHALYLLRHTDGKSSDELYKEVANMEDKAIIVPTELTADDNENSEPASHMAEEESPSNIEIR